MFNNRLMHVVFIFSTIIIFICPYIAAARQTIVLGTIGVGYDYWERTYDEDDSDVSTGDRREYSAWPEIEVQSNGIHDALSLRYAPVFSYDHVDETKEVNHYLDLIGDFSLSQKWSVDVSDTFALTTDPSRYGSAFNSGGLTDQGETPTAEITNNLGRRRFWTNDLTLETTYTYAEDSDVGLGYSYRVLRNDSHDDVFDIEYDEFDRHELFGTWSNRISPSWRTQLDLNYVKGLYEDIEESELSQDLQEYWADLRLDYIKDVSNTFPFLYSFRGTRYEDVRGDIWVHNLTLGWNHAFDSHTNITIGVGPSYQDYEDSDGEWGYNGYLDFTKTYQHWDIGVLFDKSYEPQNFTGSSDSGFTDSSDLTIDATYQFTRDLTSTIFGQFRYEDILDPQGDYADSSGDESYSRESYSAGANVDYTFLRWFVATVGYVYFQQDGDLSQDSYTDHRITLTLSASKELWR